MDIRERIREYEEQRARFELGGGPKAIEKVHAGGRLTARERIEKLIDPGSFREFNLWAKPALTGTRLDERESPGDAAVTGFGKIEGHPICIYAHDFTVLGGTQAPVQNWKVCKAIDTAVKLGIPYVGIVDSGGVRVDDAFGPAQSGRGVSKDADVWYSPPMALGAVPSISLVVGASFAGTAYSPMMADFFIMCDQPYCFMALSSPSLLKTVTSLDVTYSEIGGARIHAEISGSCDYFSKDEEDAIAATRELLTLLPANCREKPPFKDTGDDPSRKDDSLADIIPNDLKQPYDMHEIILRLVDNSHFLELKKGYAQNIITGYARLGGYSVGIIANNPAFLDGAMDLKSAEKEARFIRTCDCFNVPLIFLVDTPGFVADPQQEKMGLMRHAAMVMYAICEATVPKITVYLRRCYKEGYFAMGTRLMGNDLLFAWPNAQIQLVDFREAVETICHQPIEEMTPEELEQFSKKYFDSPYHPGALLMIDDIINPKDTRALLVDALGTTANKELVRPEKKKHGNIPL